MQRLGHRPHELSFFLLCSPFLAKGTSATPCAAEAARSNIGADGTIDVTDLYIETRFPSERIERDRELNDGYQVCDINDRHRWLLL